jgi:hypothetical protein
VGAVLAAAWVPLPTQQALCLQHEEGCGGEQGGGGGRQGGGGQGGDGGGLMGGNMQ